MSPWHKRDTRYEKSAQIVKTDLCHPEWDGVSVLRVPSRDQRDYRAASGAQGKRGAGGV